MTGPQFRDRTSVTAWVEREEIIKTGDQMGLHIPDQPVWAHQPA